MDYKALQTKLDSNNMLARIDEWSAIFQKGFGLGYSMDLSDEFKAAKHVIGLGMGGSGMAYRILAALTGEFGTVSVEVVSDYPLPVYAQKDSGVAVCITSFSGNTEEPLAAVEEARKRGLPIACVATGGKLAAWAKQYSYPLAQFEYPVGPRTGLAYTFGITFGMFCKAGFLKFDQPGPDVVKRALADLAAHSTQASMQAEAQGIAESMKDKMVYVVGSGLSLPVATRWKGQINENAKQIAFVEPMPEMCHNMYLGYDLPENIRKESAVVFLDSHLDHPQNRKRNRLVGDDLAKTGVTILYPEVSSELSPLGTLLAQMILGDYASYYLALLNDKDPSEMDRIEELKKRL